MSTNRLQRAHRSTKIPNSKLRPAPAPSAAAAARADADAEDDAHFRRNRHQGKDKAYAPGDFAGAAQRRPLEGFTVCLTGISEEKVRARRATPRLTSSANLWTWPGTWAPVCSWTSRAR